MIKLGGKFLQFFIPLILFIFADNFFHRSDNDSYNQIEEDVGRYQHERNKHRFRIRRVDPVHNILPTFHGHQRKERVKCGEYIAEFFRRNLTEKCCRENRKDVKENHEQQKQPPDIWQGFQHGCYNDPEIFDPSEQPRCPEDTQSTECPETAEYSIARNERNGYDDKVKIIPSAFEKRGTIRIEFDQDFNKKYIEFLKNGTNKPAVEILKEIGIDLTTDEPFETAFKFMQEQLDLYKSITK